MAFTKPQLRLVKNETQHPGTDSGSRKGGGAAEHVLYVERLYHEYRTSLAAYVANLLPGGQQDAESIIQDTYVRLLRLRDLNHLSTSPRAYLFAVATNLVRDSLRKHLRRHSDRHQPLDEEELFSPDLSPLHNIQWQQSLNHLKVGLLELNSTTRQVFFLSRYEGMTYAEIADVLSISTRTVERHMSMALKHLQKVLEDCL